MTKIRITMEVSDEIADPDHEMGVTTEGYEELMEALMPFGDDINIRQV